MHIDDSMALYNTYANLYSSPIVLILVIVFSLITIVGMWKMYQKAGYHGWECLIPFYCAYIQTKIAMGNGWLFLIGLIPIANIIFNIVLIIKTADVFGKGIGFAVLLYFLPPIGYIMLGLGDAEYYGIQ